MYWLEKKVELTDDELREKIKEAEIKLENVKLNLIGTHVNQTRSHLIPNPRALALADAGADHSEIEKAYYWVQRENKFLQYLDRALEMIEEGTFGICKTCNDRINSERLLEVPHTTSCFDCKNKS